MTRSWLAFIESNTSGTGRLFVRTARELGFRPVLLAADPARYPWSRSARQPTQRLMMQ